MNVDREILGQISTIQLLEWQVFEQLEPFGEDREDIRNAHLVRTMMNLWGWDRKKRSKPFELADAVLTFGDQPTFKRESPNKSAADLKAICRMIYESNVQP